MNLQLYSYANIVRILYIDEDEFSQSIIIDINTDNGEILSIFDASKQFDADFIRSFIDILRVSTTGFKLIYETDNDSQSITAASNTELSPIDKVLSALNSKVSDCPKIKQLRPFLSK